MTNKEIPKGITGKNNSYFDSGDKIAEIQGCFIVTLELFMIVYENRKCNHEDAKFYHKIIRQKIKSADLILKTNQKDIPHYEYVILKKTLEKQWELYHKRRIIFQKLYSKKEMSK